jgi:uncharacterized cupredoxin-like copper-binding protein
MAPMLISLAASLALGLAAAMPLDWSQAQTISVVATEYEFATSRLTFRVGEPARLHLENRGTELHEFTAPAFLKTVELGNPDALNADRSEVVLQPGEQKDLYFVPRQAGRYLFICADHDWAGMRGEILVEPGP